MSFDLSGTSYTVRVATSNRDGVTRGDLMLQDPLDGTFKWISQSGDPNELLAERPSDPVNEPNVAEHASGAEVDETATIFYTEAHIPDEELFDVPDVEGIYDVTLDFDLSDVVLFNNIDPTDHTLRDVVDLLEVGRFIGKTCEGSEHLVVHPTVIYMGNLADTAR